MRFAQDLFAFLGICSHRTINNVVNWTVFTCFIAFGCRLLRLWDNHLHRCVGRHQYWVCRNEPQPLIFELNLQFLYIVKSSSQLNYLCQLTWTLVNGTLTMPISIVPPFMAVLISYLWAPCAFGPSVTNNWTARYAFFFGSFAFWLMKRVGSANELYSIFHWIIFPSTCALPTTDEQGREWIQHTRFIQSSPEYMWLCASSARCYRIHIGVGFWWNRIDQRQQHAAYQLLYSVHRFCVHTYLNLLRIFCSIKLEK